MTDWVPEGEPWGQQDKKTVPVSFRANSKIAALAEELIIDHQSKYYGMFKNRSELLNHLFTVGVIALAEDNRSTKGLARSLALQQRVLSLAARKETSRDMMKETVDRLLNRVTRDEDGGKGGVEEFLALLLTVDEELRATYSNYLLTHPSCPMFLPGESGMVDEMRGEYVS